MEWLAMAQVTTAWMILKWIYLFAFGIYVIFALVVVSQVKQMLMALSGGFDRGLKVIAWGNFGLAVLAFILAIVVL